MNRLIAVLSASFLCTLVAPHASAQGSDNCATATAISGNGTFSVSTVGSTDSAQQTGACPTAHNDVWFAWTAPLAGSMNLTLCGGTSIDTVIAVYPGTSCPSAGTQLACNDDSCGLQSSVFFNATSGSTYLFQIGAFSPGNTFTGSFSIGPGTGGCPNQSTGPDVIVGNITDVLNVTATGGIDAISLGTDACNVGSAPLPWVASTNHHPVIGNTLYRYHVVSGTGRFEEVGISWLKHAFAAGAGSTCCTCQGGGGGGLGVGCSDVYGAGLNGSQSGLGPRWQVNAFNGVYTYPPASPAFSGALARRCEVSLSELEVSGGTTHFFGECTYVTPEDAQAGNNNNNASYTELAVTGGPADFTFNLSGGTHRMQPAIQAWPVVEPGVTLTNVQVPGEGLFIVGSHATSLGGGQYHYEYAVLNMNSDRAGGSFSVPVAPGVTVTNIGFHDVTYRDGDGQGSANQTGTDWIGTLSANSVDWACETQAQNANANAIRWAATYNFRFDANTAPQSGNVTLGLWKTGSPASVTAVGDVPGGGATTFTYCYGDGTGAACPCGNNSPVGANAGCLNSLGTGGALATSGTPSVGADTFVLGGSGMPDSSALYFQGTTQSATQFGDGLRCAAGSVIRLGTKTNALGTSQYPAAGDQSISLRGSNAVGDVRTYQCWYRNPAAFCTSSTFNLTNAAQTTWQP